MRKVVLYVDGSCDNDGHRNEEKTGGYGYIMFYEGEAPVETSGTFTNATNNRAEMMGPIAALESLTEPHEIDICSDSAYVVNCFNQRWYERWFRNGWVNSKGKPVENKDLWLRLFAAMKGHKVKFVKVKGHSTDAHNNRCDALAKKSVRGT